MCETNEKRITAATENMMDRVNTFIMDSLDEKCNSFILLLCLINGLVGLAATMIELSNGERHDDLIDLLKSIPDMVTKRGKGCTGTH